MLKYWLNKVFAKTARRTASPLKQSPRLQLESLEEKAVPATLDVTGGKIIFTAGTGITNNLSVYISGTNYIFNDTAETITLTTTARAAGFGGGGTNTVSGPVAAVTSNAADAISIDLGNSDDTFNLRSLAAGDQLTVNTGADADIVNLSSDGAGLLGNLNNILSEVTVTNSAGADNLRVSDFSATAANTAVAVNGGTISGLAPANISFGGGGTYALVRLIGSNNFADTFTLGATTAPTAPLQIDANGGADLLYVNNIGSAVTFNGGAGNDVGVIGGVDGTTTNRTLANIGANITFAAGAGTNTLSVGNFANTTGFSSTSVASNVMTYSVGTSRTVNYSNSGGTLNLNIDGSNTATDTLTLGTIGSGTRTTLTTNGGADSVTVNGSVAAYSPTISSISTGAGDDTIAMGDGLTDGSIAGNVNGGTGGETAYDTLTYAGHTGGTSVDVTLASSSASYEFTSKTGFATGITGTFSNIGNLIGSSTKTSNLTGYSVGNGGATGVDKTVWTLDNTTPGTTYSTLRAQDDTDDNGGVDNDYYLNFRVFNGILTGGTGDDYFTATTDFTANLVGGGSNTGSNGISEYTIDNGKTLTGTITSTGNISNYKLFGTLTSTVTGDSTEDTIYLDGSETVTLVSAGANGYTGKLSNVNGNAASGIVNINNFVSTGKTGNTYNFAPTSNTLASYDNRSIGITNIAADTLSINDSGTAMTPNYVYTIGNTVFNGGGVAINTTYPFANVTLSAAAGTGTGNNLVSVEMQATGSTFTVNGNSGDTLKISNVAAANLTKTGTTVTSTGKGDITWSGFTLFSGSDNRFANNAPTAVIPTQTVTTASGATAGTTVATLAATDADVGETFTFAGDETDLDFFNYFEIGGVNGNEIIVKAGATIAVGSYTFNVTVTDGAGATFSESVTLTFT